MKVVLKYRRGTRPRGSWRFPLWFALSVHYSAEETAGMNPDWFFQQIFVFNIPQGRSVAAEPKQRATAVWEMGGVFRAVDHTGTPCYWDDKTRGLLVTVNCVEADRRVEKTLYFSHAADRDVFVLLLHSIKDAVTLAAAEWWKANPEVPGDAAELEFSSYVDEKTGNAYDLQVDPKVTEAAEPVFRRIRPNLGQEDKT